MRLECRILGRSYPRHPGPTKLTISYLEFLVNSFEDVTHKQMRKTGGGKIAEPLLTDCEGLSFQFFTGPANRQKGPFKAVSV